VHVCVCMIADRCIQRGLPPADAARSHRYLHLQWARVAHVWSTHHWCKSQLKQLQNTQHQHTHTHTHKMHHTNTHTQNTQLQHTHIGAHWRTHALSCAHARNTERNLEVSEETQAEILETKISGKTWDDVWCLIRFCLMFWPEPLKQTDWGSASKHRVHRLHTRLAADLLVLDYRAGHGARRFSALAPVRYWYFTSAYGRLQVPPRHEWTSGAHTCVCVVCSVCLLHVYGWGSVGSHHHICVWRKQGWRLRHTWILYTSRL